MTEVFGSGGMLLPLSSVTRIEIIDEQGRAFTRWNVAVHVDFQDDYRTMKIWVKEKTDE